MGGTKSQISPLTTNSVYRFGAQFVIHNNLTVDVCTDNELVKLGLCESFKEQMYWKIVAGQAQIRHWMVQNGGKEVAASSKEANECQIISFGVSADKLICLDAVSPNNRSLIYRATLTLYYAALAFANIAYNY